MTLLMTALALFFSPALGLGSDREDAGQACISASINRLLKVTEKDLLPATQQAVEKGNKVFGAVISRKSDLSLVVAGMTAREALEIATLGGAKVLGRDDIGHLAPGMCADFVTFDLNRKPFVGVHADPVATLILCQNDRVDYSLVNGGKLVDNGMLATDDYGALAEKTRKLQCRLWA